MSRTAEQQPHRLAHGRNVRRNIDGVGDQQQTHQSVEDRQGEYGLDVGGQSLAGDVPQARAHHLNAHHQRIGEQYRPEHVVAELGAGLAVGRDAARVVIGSARDEAWAQLLDPGIVRNAFEEFDHAFSASEE